MKQLYVHKEPVTLESGETLPELTIAYNTFGKLSADRDNVVWVMHALTADSDVSDWWPHTVEKGRFLDPDKWFVVCANVIGSCYGSTGPTSVNPDTGKPYFKDFPDVTVRDMVMCHRLLAEHLGIKHINTIVGSSLGGFQAIEWLVTEPDIADRAVLIATDYRCRPWLAAINRKKGIYKPSCKNIDRKILPVMSKQSSKYNGKYNHGKQRLSHGPYNTKI